MAAPTHAELFARFKPDCVVPTGVMVDGLDEIELDNRRSVNAGEGRRIESVFWNVHPLAQQVGIVGRVDPDVRVFGRDVANLFDGNHPYLARQIDGQPLQVCGFVGGLCCPG